jgi:hypothetical protein
MVELGNSGTDRYELIAADLVDEQMPWRHDSEKLAKVILDLYSSKVNR